MPAPTLNGTAAEPAPAVNQHGVCRKRILLVDDQNTVRQAIKYVLRLDEHVVAEAADGAAALELFMRGQFDLVITDFEMPNMRGNELAAKIKQVSHNQPILMLTGHAGRLRASENLVDAILEKPFQIEDLRRAIHELLS